MKQTGLKSNTVKLAVLEPKIDGPNRRVVFLLSGPNSRVVFLLCGPNS